MIPGLGRSPGEGNGNTRQYSCLENFIDSIAWRSTVHGVHGVAESDTTEPLTQAKFTLSRLQTLMYQFCSYSYLSLIFYSNKDPHLRGLLLGRKVMTNLDSIFKSRDITLPTKVRLVKAMDFLWSCMDVRVGL